VRLLLDTHAWHWAAADDRRLSATAREIIDAAENELAISAISLWEFRVNVRRGRIAVNGDINAWIRQSLDAMGIAVLPITGEIALQSEDLAGFGNQDPADRFIVATALLLGLPIVTTDAVISAWQVRTLW
jgi:PIN domain nuclease of toxin-antitoxin system